MVDGRQRRGWKSRRTLDSRRGSDGGNSMNSSSKQRVKRGTRSGTREDEQIKEIEGEEQEHGE